MKGVKGRGLREESEGQRVKGIEFREKGKREKPAARMSLETG